MKKSVFKKIRESFRGEKKHFAQSLNAYSSYYQTPGKAVWSGRNYAKFSDEAYTKNVIAHQSIKKIASATASVKLKISKDGTALGAAHPLVKILTQPNPCACGADFLEEVISYKMISGNAYIVAVGAAGEAPTELHCLRPDRVSIIAGKDGTPSAFRYRLGDNRYRDYPTEKVLHLKYFHPLDDWYGLSPIEAAAYSIDQHNQAGEWNQALLQNGARPSGALVVKQGENGSGGQLTEDQYTRVKAQIDDQFMGGANAGRPILLEGGLEWKEMSLRPTDMDFMEMKHSAARDIALAFGVPPQLLGIPGDNTYSNLAEARLAMWEQTVLPLTEKIVESLNNWLVPMFDSGVVINADLDNIPALTPRIEALWKRINDADFLSEEEKRAILKIKS